MHMRAHALNILYTNVRQGTQQTLHIHLINFYSKIKINMRVATRIKLGQMALQTQTGIKQSSLRLANSHEMRGFSDMKPSKRMSDCLNQPLRLVTKSNAICVVFAPIAITVLGSLPTGSVITCTSLFARSLCINNLDCSALVAWRT